MPKVGISKTVGAGKPGLSSPATAPDAPSSLTATKQACELEIDLSWGEPFNVGSAITGYKIERKIGAGAYGTLVADTGNTLTTYTDTGLTAGTQYTYRVSAINSVGTSSASNEDDDTTSTAPGAPTGLTATATSDDIIELSWTAPASDGGCAVSGYKIERESPTGGGWSTIVADTGNTDTTYPNSGLTAGTEYNYRVSAINNIGTSSASTEDAATTIPYFYSFHFNGISARVIDFGDPAAITSAVNTAGVFSFRIGLRKLTNTSTLNRMVIGKWKPTGSNQEFQLIINTANRLVFRASPSGASTATATGTVQLTGLDWADGYEIVVVYNKNGATNADKVKMWVNGVQDTFTFGGTFSTIFNGNDTLKIGLEGAGGTFDELNAYVNYVTFTSDQITGAEAASLWNSGLPLKSDAVLNNIILHCDFNNATFDGTNWSIPDLSGNSITGTSANMSINERPSQNFYTG